MPSGRLLALEAEVYSDVGAYGIYPWGQVLEALGTPMIMPGPYVVPAYRYRTHSVATNKPPQGAYRGVGLPVAALAHERLMDMLAGELGIDRAEIRRVNYIPPERFPFKTATGLRYDSGRYQRALDLALERIGYDEFTAEQQRAAQQGRTIGLGFASYVEWTGTNSETYRQRGMRTVRGYDAGRVALNPDGTFSVWTSCPALGQGVQTTFAQIVAEHLGVPLASVRTELTDTEQAPAGSGSFASRSAISAGGALISVSRQLRERLLALAAESLEARPDDIVIEGDRAFVRGSPRAGIQLAELAARAVPGQFDLAEPYDPEQTAYPYATHACVVEIDPVTGEVTILRYVVVEDCGPEINPIVVEGQVHGATAQGIGGTLFETLRYGPDGQPLTASFMDYLVPGACELPTLVVEHLETPAPDLRAGHKGVGEGGTLAPGPALANAVSNALGTDVDQLPITPELTLQASASDPAGDRGRAPMSPTLLGADAQTLAETRAFNARLEQALAAEEPLSSAGIPEARRRRREGSPTGFPPPAVFLDQARELDVPSRAGTTRVRILAPEREPTGIYLHLHGGGWMLGAADLQDTVLFELAQETGLCAVSVEYRLAPEDPFPACADDCEDVALWLLTHGADHLRTPPRFVIGGESAGAHLAVLTLLRLRDRHGLKSPFAAANLSFGAFDLSQTPSARLWGDRNLILSTPNMEFFLDCFLPGLDRESRRASEISPLSARLDGLPPAIFTVGTQDPLLDDTLFMNARWAAAGNPAQLRVWSEATHAFISFPIGIAREARAEQYAFLRDVL